MAAIYNKYRENLLDRPSVKGDRCVVCGRFANNNHHVIPKGMGGIPKSLESRIPTLVLCGQGNVSGCHGLAHQKKLHLNWSDGLGGWVWLITPNAMDDEFAWQRHRKLYRPIRTETWVTFGGKS